MLAHVVRPLDPARTSNADHRVGASVVHRRKVMARIIVSDGTGVASDPDAEQSGVAAIGFSSGPVDHHPSPGDIRLEGGLSPPAVTDLERRQDLEMLVLAAS